MLSKYKIEYLETLQVEKEKGGTAECMKECGWFSTLNCLLKRHPVKGEALGEQKHGREEEGS